MSPSLFTEHRSTCDLPLRPTGGLAVWLVGLLLAVSLLLFTDQSVTVLSPSLVISHGAAPIKSGWLFTSKGLPSFTTDMCTGHLIARILFLHLLLAGHFKVLQHFAKPMSHLKCRDDGNKIFLGRVPS